MTRIGHHAIVIGGSMGGLLAARALADDFETVTLLERDVFPVTDGPRKGVPQGDHAHGLLARGRNVVEALFPGWTDEVVADGGIRCDIARDVTWFGHGIALKPAPSDLVGLLASRPVLEGHVRRRLLALPNLRAIENCAVQGLMAADDKSAVTGVRVRIDAGAEQTIAADLVVDASGRGSQSPVWLDALGYARPEEERIEIGLGYTTRLYRRRPSDLGGKVAVVVAGSEPNWRSGVILFQSEDLLDRLGRRLFRRPRTRQRADVRRLCGVVSDTGDPRHRGKGRAAQRFQDLSLSRQNLRRRYERLARFPNNYLVFGDAVCSFNPVYGQGMTVAAQEAVLLREAVRAGTADLARRFFTAASAVIDTPWDIAVGNDLRHPQVHGPRPVKVTFINWYIGKLHHAAQHDGVLAGAFLRVANLEAQPAIPAAPGDRVARDPRQSCASARWQRGARCACEGVSGCVMTLSFHPAPDR